MARLIEDYGAFKVSTLCLERFGSGSHVHYVLMFTKDGLMAAKIGKGSVIDEDKNSFYGSFGALGGFLASREMKRRRGKQDKKASELMELTAEEILNSDKQNFEIAYSDIDKIIMEKKRSAWRERTGMLKIEGKGVTPALVKLGWSATEGLFRKKPRIEMEFDIPPNQDFEECLKIVSTATKSKLVVK